jgi:hypothetical protein
VPAAAASPADGRGAPPSRRPPAPSRRRIREPGTVIRSGPSTVVIEAVMNLGSIDPHLHRPIRLTLDVSEISQPVENRRVTPVPQGRYISARDFNPLRRRGSSTSASD